MEIISILCMCFGGIFIFAGVIGLQSVHSREEKVTAGGFIDGIFGGPIAFMRGFIRAAQKGNSPAKPLLMIFLAGCVLVALGFTLWKIAPIQQPATQQDQTNAVQ